MDSRTGYGNNFEQRSAGFQWFFSFLVAFSEFERRDEATVVLLDEPGLSLHGRAQADYLRFIDERLAPTGQVMYTTHSPFMVKVEALDRVRLVEDQGPDSWAVVTDDVLASDPDSLFPLQAALGYDIAQNLFIGPDNLVIEGTSDFTYLTVLSDQLKAHERGHLDVRWRLLPAGGSSNIPTFVALIGPHLEVTVLTDSSHQAMQRLTAMQANGLLPKSRLLSIGEVLGRKHADIEDMFEEADYRRLYNGAFDKGLTSDDLASGDRIIDRIERSDVGGPFDHGLPADYLLRNRMDFPFSETTLSRFEDLFEQVNATLS